MYLRTYFFFSPSAVSLPPSLPPLPSTALRFKPSSPRPCTFRRGRIVTSPPTQPTPLSPHTYLTNATPLLRIPFLATRHSAPSPPPPPCMPSCEQSPHTTPFCGVVFCSQQVKRRNTLCQKKMDERVTFVGLVFQYSREHSREWRERETQYHTQSPLFFLSLSEQSSPSPSPTHPPPPPHAPPADPAPIRIVQLLLYSGQKRRFLALFRPPLLTTPPCQYLHPAPRLLLSCTRGVGGRGGEGVTAGWGEATEKNQSNKQTGRCLFALHASKAKKNGI